MPRQRDAVDPLTTLAEYLDFFRAETRRKLDGLDTAALHTSVLPSGWAPIELLAHLVHMERRWLVWGFLGEDVESPWGDDDDEGRWHTDLDVGVLLGMLDEGGRRTTAIVYSHTPEQRAATGGRFPEDDETPTLLSILFHVLQEYARHVGHLDIARELADGEVGEG